MVELKEKYTFAIDEKMDSKMISVQGVNPFENHFLYVTTDSRNNSKMKEQSFIKHVLILDKNSKVIEKYDSVTVDLMQEFCVVPKSICNELEDVTTLMQPLPISRSQTNDINILIEVCNIPLLCTKIYSNNVSSSLGNCLSQKLSISTNVYDKKNVEIDLNVMRYRNIEELWISIENDIDLKGIYLNHENYSHEINPVLSKHFYPHNLYNLDEFIASPCYVIPFDTPKEFSNENLSKILINFRNGYSGSIHITSFGNLIEKESRSNCLEIKYDKIVSIGVLVLLALFVYILMSFIHDLFNDMSSCLLIAF